MNFTVETNDLPKVDVLVAGGGPAGCAAAVATPIPFGVMVPCMAMGGSSYCC